MKKLSLIITIVICSSYLFSQSFSSAKHNRIWYFSESNAGLYFNDSTNQVSTTYEHAPLAYEGSSVVADPQTGILQFYTSYLQVFDRTHQQMPNGGGLLSDITCSTTSLICPVPSMANKYYLFSNSATAPNSGNISYSIVDMNLAGNGTSQDPLGDVVQNQKNLFLTSNSSEGFCLVAGNVGVYWLIIPVNNSDTIKIYKIDENGIVFFNNTNTGFNIGDARAIRYSFSAGKIAIMNMYEYQPSIVFNFDYVTGVITNIFKITGTPMGTQTNYWYGFYDCEWSPDGSKLYMSKYRNATPATGGRLYQYDLNNPNNSPVLIYTISSNFSNMSSGLKVGPDNKIYFLYNNTTYSDHRIVGIINFPNNQGTSCDFNAVKFTFSANMPQTHKFPEFLPINEEYFGSLSVVLNNVVDASENSLCNGSIDISVIGGVIPYTFLWSNGQSSQDIDSLCAGVYTVTVTDSLMNTSILSITVNQPTTYPLHNHTWYFSQTSYGLNFDNYTNAVSVVNGHSPLTYGGCGMLTNPQTGDVLMYSNGVIVVDKEHNQMPNGSGLYGSIYSATNGLICSVPFQNNKFYVFSNSANINANGTIYYSIVDLNLIGNGTSSNPLGDVDLNFKNIALASNSGQAFGIINGANNDYWLVYPKKNTDTISVYHIDINGINFASNYNMPWVIENTRTLKYCVENNKVAIGNMVSNQPSILFDFDISNGVIANVIAIPGTPAGTASNFWEGFFDTEWSASGNMLYLTKYRTGNTGGSIYQYNLNTPDSEIVEIYHWASYYDLAAGLKRGPDNRIYLLYHNQTYDDHRILGIINNPENVGVSCNFVANGLNMNVPFYDTHDFPIISTPIEYVADSNLTAIVSNIINVSCFSNCNASASITATGGTTPYSYLWSNGETSSTINNLCAGSYSVTVTDAASDNIVQQLVITEPSVLTLSITDIQGTGCNGENNGSATVLASGGVLPYSFLWDGISGANASTASNLTAGSYNVVVVDSFSCIATANVVIPAADFGIITGTVQFSIGYVGAGDGVVHLYKANVPGFYEVDSSAIYSNGSFILEHVPAGDYFLYVKMDNHANNPDYNIIHNTYYDSTYKWIDALVLTMACGDSINLIVNMYEKSQGSSGNGNISGNIHYNSNNKAITGEPVPGSEITLEQEPDDAPIAGTSSDITGFYEFTDIAEGNYSIYIDIPGLPHVSTYSVSVTSTDTVFINLNFVVDTITSSPGIYSDSTVIVNYITAHYSISVFPNPFIQDLNIKYSMKTTGNITFELIDIEGRTIESYNNSLESGNYNYSFKGLKSLGRGIYVLKIVVDNTVYIKKLIKN